MYAFQEIPRLLQRPSALTVERLSDVLSARGVSKPNPTVSTLSEEVCYCKYHISLR